MHTHHDIEYYSKQPPVVCPTPVDLEYVAIHVSYIQIAVGLVWDSCGVAVVLLWNCYGIAVGLGDGFSLGLLWNCRSIAVRLLWYCRGIAVVLL